MLGETPLPTLPPGVGGEPLATAGDYTVATPAGVWRPGCAAAGLNNPLPAAAGVLGATAGLLSSVVVTAGVGVAAGNKGAAAAGSQ